jgi:hypothetical protein
VTSVQVRMFNVYGLDRGDIDVKRVSKDGKPEPNDNEVRVYVPLHYTEEWIDVEQAEQLASMLLTAAYEAREAMRF